MAGASAIVGEEQAKNRPEIRFAFGKNWQRFLRMLDPERIAAAEKSLRDMLEVEDLSGKSFLDAGCGSGLFSLAAMRLGAAKVHSFDYDPDSAACARELKQRFFEGSNNWTIEQGDVLDPAYLSPLGRFDIVYSWGVLHHTGNMHRAFENVTASVVPEGKLFISIYNDQGLYSRGWKLVKRNYSRWPVLRPFMVVGFGSYFVMRDFAVDLLILRRNPFQRYRSKVARGMAKWPDLLDWLGGYPFEVASAKYVSDYFSSRGFNLRRLKDVGRQIGCNEFVFINETEPVIRLRP
jgi:2-polyprenyl-6-hydroxyphenyl methylase/3-demethylubiquinone-9 3-methyltransferase